MSDFDLLLEAVLNERFIDDSSAYYDDPISSTEIADQEQGLYSDFAHADVKHLLKDKGGHHEDSKVLRYPGRVGSNYDRGKFVNSESLQGQDDDLSVYKILPRGQRPLV